MTDLEKAKAEITRLREALQVIADGTCNWGVLLNVARAALQPRPPGVEVKDAGSKGRGIFSASDVPAGTTIIEAPILYLDQLHHHVWEHKGKACIALGPHQLVNHGMTANCRCECDGETDKLISIRDIEEGEELTIDYIKHFGSLGFNLIGIEGLVVQVDHQTPER